MRKLNFKPIISKGTMQLVTTMGMGTEMDALRVALGGTPKKGTVTTLANTNRLSRPTATRWTPL